MEEKTVLPIDWEKYGFKVRSDGGMEREDFPLVLDDYNGFLVVWLIRKEDGLEVDLKISEDKIPATNQAVVLLLKAFNCSKLP